MKHLFESDCKILFSQILVVSILLAGVGVANASILDVCPSGCSYSSIQAAVNAASNGDTITVDAGTYTENVRIAKSINLVGAGATSTSVNANYVGAHVFEVTTNSVNISGFTVTGANYCCYAGIYYGEADFGNIMNNNASNNWYGIRLDSSNNNNIVNKDRKSVV